jgi:hypothetical protein
MVTSKPWLSAEIPREVYFPKGMLGAEERRMLFWLARECFLGRGVVVDAGAYVGASAFCLASGLSQSEHADAPSAVVHSYDLFIANEAYLTDPLSGDFGPITTGDSFRDVFEFQTGKYADRIVIHEGDFLTQSAPDQIEILFIDVAKTERLNQRVLCSFFPKLIPGVSVVIQQDYYQTWHPYIPISMWLLNEYFELIDPLVPLQSRVWRLKKEIPVDALVKASQNRPVEENVRLLDRLIEEEMLSEMVEALKVTKLGLLLTEGLTEEAKAYNDTLPDASHDGPLWQTQLADWRGWHGYKIGL